MEGLNFVGAGLACLAMLGAAIGVGNIFASYLDGAMRNPSAVRETSRFSKSPPFSAFWTRAIQASSVAWGKASANFMSVIGFIRFAHRLVAGF